MKNLNAITIIPIAVFIFAALLYGRTANFGIVWDDAMVLNASKMPLTQAGVREIFTTPVDRLYRPLRTLCYSIEHSLNANAREFHVTNAMLYALSCYIFFYLVLQLSGSLPIAACSTALFAAHPLHAEVVSSISNGRADLLCAVFIFSSLYFYLLTPRKLANAILSLLLFVLAALSKESAIVFSGIIFIIAFSRALNGKSARASRALLTAILSALPFIAVSIIYIFIRHKFIGGVSQASFYHGGGLKNTILTSMSVVPDYAAALFVPVKQCALYNIPALVSVTPKITAGIFIILSLLIIGVALIRKSFLVSFSLLFMLLTWIPASNIIPIASIKAARFMFLPTAGACLLFAVLINYAANSLVKSGAPATIFAALSTLAIVCVYSISSLSASSVWRDSKTLWSDSVSCAPDSPTAWNNYGKTIYVEGGAAKAEAAFLKAISINPGFPQPYDNLAAIYGNSGRYGDAINMLIKRKSLGGSTDVDCKLSFAYRKVGDLQKSAERFNECKRAMSKER